MRETSPAPDIEAATRIIHPSTHHFQHQGYTRAPYLANGDIFLSGPQVFDPKDLSKSRTECRLSVLNKSLAKPPIPLGTKCSESPGFSRPPAGGRELLADRGGRSDIPSGAFCRNKTMGRDPCPFP